MVEGSVEETLTYCDFPSEHGTKIRTNNVIERMNREIRRRTRVVGAFPDGNSALMLVCARLRHVGGTQWGSKRYMNMKHLDALEDDVRCGYSSPSPRPLSIRATSVSTANCSSSPSALRRTCVPFVMASIITFKIERVLAGVVLGLSRLAMVMLE